MWLIGIIPHLPKSKNVSSRRLLFCETSNEQVSSVPLLTFALNFEVNFIGIFSPTLGASMRQLLETPSAGHVLGYANLTLSNVCLLRAKFN